jgi:hypothetical protein
MLTDVYVLIRQYIRTVQSTKVYTGKYEIDAIDIDRNQSKIQGWKIVQNKITHPSQK